MHLKYYLKLTLVIFLIPLFLVLMFSFSAGSLISESPNKIEANKLGIIINQKKYINVTGMNLKLNTNDFLTTETIDNDLNIQSYEKSYLSFVGFLKTNAESQIKIIINVNGYTKTIYKNMFYFSGNYSNDLNKNINYIDFFNNYYYLSTNEGLYSSDDGIHFKSILLNYNIIKFYCDINNKNLFLLTNDNKILEFNLMNSKVIDLNINLKITNLIINTNFIYISTNSNLYCYSNITKKITIIYKDSINDLEKYNGYIYFSSFKGLYKIDESNNSISIVNNNNIDKFVFTKINTIYWISNNKLFYYYNNILKNIIINNSIQLKNLFISNNNILLITTSQGLYYLNQNNFNFINYFDEDNISLFQNITNTFYIYSTNTLYGITFFQMDQIN